MQVCYNGGIMDEYTQTQTPAPAQSLRQAILSRTGHLCRADVARLPSLTLAYVGDTFYDLYVRTVLCATSFQPVHTLYLRSIECVSAAAQSAAAHRILDDLDEEELAVFKRARNTRIHTLPKHAKVQDYRYATGLEALLGYLYLMQREQRALELLALALPQLCAQQPDQAQTAPQL